MNLNLGSTLQGGKYKIQKVLGQGGFGITYLAEQRVTIKGGMGEIDTVIRVAIKEFFMKDSCNRDPETSHVSVPSVGSKELVNKFKAKFVKEASNLAKLRHDHIIKVLDVFEENGTAYYVMEYIDGGSLNEHVSQCGVLSEAESLHYIRQISDALKHIHAQKINHLDIKPSNILLKEGAISVLIDFGLAKQYDNSGDQTSSTPIGVSKGYAPIEQYKAGGVSTFSPATDIYSMGATLYKLVTGSTPPDAHDVFDSGLPELPANLSDGTKQAIIASMNPSRAARPQSIIAFLDVLSGNNVDTEETVIVKMPEIKTSKIVKSKLQPIVPPRPVADTKKSVVHDEKNTNKRKILIGASAVGLLVIILFLLFKPGSNVEVISNSGDELIENISENSGDTVSVNDDGIELAQVASENKKKAAELEQERKSEQARIAQEQQEAQNLAAEEERVANEKAELEQKLEEERNAEKERKRKEDAERIEKEKEELERLQAIEDNEELPYVTVEVMPKFQGGDVNKFREWVSSKIRYPKTAKDSGISGRVILSFIIEKDGRLTNIEVLTSPDVSLKDEAVRVVKQSPNWTPGMQRNNAVRVKCTFPIVFKL